MNIFGGGWGGRPDEDGEDASVSVCQGDVRNAPVELQEIKYPVLVETHALRARFWRRRPASWRAWRRTDLSASAKLQGQHQSRPHPRSAVGPALGGKSGAINECHIHRADGTEAAVKKATEIEIAAGDRVVFLTAGGGGYGDPSKRAPEETAQDFAAGVVTKKGRAKA